MKKKQNMVLVTLTLAVAIILFWKGVWTIADMLFDQWLFQDPLVANLAAIAAGIAIIVYLKKKTNILSR